MTRHQRDRHISDGTDPWLATTGVATHLDRVTDAGHVKRHAQQACGHENGGGDDGDAEIGELEQERESEQDGCEYCSHGQSFQVGRRSIDRE
jgi:hypothetical protein